MLLKDLAGEITPDPAHLHSFITNWYSEDDYVALVAIPSKEFQTETKRNKVLSQAVSVKDLAFSTVEELTGLVMGPDIQYNMYLGINPLKNADKITLHSRGNETEIREIYGVFIDFDIKSGSFTDKQDAQNFIDKFSSEVAEPSIVIDNGKNGGIHAYWRFNLLPDEVVSSDEAATLLKNWWSLVSEHAALWGNGIEIDRLVDLTRISRMPGGIYWPAKKLGSNTVNTPDLVRVVKYGPRYSVEQIANWCEDAGTRYEEKIKQARHKEEQRVINTNDIVRNLLDKKAGDRIGTHWGLLAAVAYIEEIFNDHWTWEEILEPYGWTFLYSDKEGRKIVARPGRHEKSATVDWDESPHIMSLLSTSPDTGLADLKQIGVALTKWRCALRFHWNDDESKMIEDVLAAVYSEKGI